MNRPGTPAVILHWDLPIPLQETHAAKKMFIRYSHTCKAFGIKRMILVNVDGLNCHYGDAELELEVVDTLEEALALVEGEQLVYVEEGGENIQTFNHPESAVYIFGSDFNGLPRADLSLATRNPLNAEIALGIVLHDRSVQWPSQSLLA